MVGQNLENLRVSLLSFGVLTRANTTPTWTRQGVICDVSQVLSQNRHVSLQSAPKRHQWPNSYKKSPTIHKTQPNHTSKTMCVKISHVSSPLVFSGAEIRSVCTEAGMFAIRARRKVRIMVDAFNLFICSELSPDLLLFWSLLLPQAQTLNLTVRS